jgi:tetratricopeptide (TPR) repeat protein
MAEPETTEPTPAPDEAQTPEPEPEPEPWTPERVTAWNAYYDVYVVLGVLFLVVIVSLSQITNSSLWAWLRAGREMSARGAPLTADPFSFTHFEQPWVNIPWTFEWAYSAIYQAIAPESLNRLPGQMLPVDQTACGVLEALTALSRLIAALLLLSLRRKGPGLWWCAVCVMLALGGVFGPPSGFTLGGIIGQPSVAPDSWGLVMLALELVILHRVLNLGRAGALFVLIPLFLVWANLDESFGTGLLFLLVAMLGSLAKPALVKHEAGPARPVGVGKGLAVLAACAAACLVNPSFYKIYGAAFAPIVQLVRPQVGPMLLDQISVFGRTIREELPSLWLLFLAYYLVIVGLGLGSFFLNRNRFSLSRFLIYMLAALLWGSVLRYRAEFGMVLAATLALNGQEWYHDRFDVQGRLGRGWALWSIGGRAVTIVVTALFLVKGLTGFASTADEPVFGWGTNPDLFPFEAADTLRAARLDGNVLNTSNEQGDALLWRAFPVRKVYIDSRPNLYSPQFRAEFEELRGMLREDDVARWKPKLDKYQITVVMLDPLRSSITYDRLSASTNWIRFYDDGNVVLFGRADAKDPDLTYFNENRLDAETLAYRRRRPVESNDQPPRMVTKFDELFFDRVFQNRFRVPPQPHVIAAYRWIPSDPASTVLPDAASCLLAVREARTALARKPEDFAGYSLLADAYRLLLLHESAILTGRTLTAANRDQISPQVSVLSLRSFQWATALNYAIRTFPPAQTAAARSSKRALNEELGRLYLSMGIIDLGYDRLKIALDLSNLPEVTPQFHTLMTQLRNQIDDVQARIAAMPDQAQADPFQKAREELRMGATGMAINDLFEADQAAVRVGVVRPLLLDLYCQTGQPDRALDLLGNTNDPTLSTMPGSSARRQGLVALLLGNYENAASLWQDNAILQLRTFATLQVLNAGREYLRGDLQSGIRAFQELPDRTNTQANWEAELGFCLLEAGDPPRAAEHFTNALVLKGDLPLRPVISYYLEKLGKPVPPAVPVPAAPPATAPEPAKDAKATEPAAKPVEPSAAKPGEPSAGQPREPALNPSEPAKKP